MSNVEFAEMNAFVAVAERASFAKAAVHLGMSRSRLSETIRSLEEKLGVRLLNRTTRSVAPTDVGQRLLVDLRPALANFAEIVETVNGYRDRPAGRLRLTVPRPALRTVVEPILAEFTRRYPAIILEIVVESGLTDIVRERFDAGIRPGHRVEADMVAVRVGEDAQPTVVASPAYLARHPRPEIPGDLQAHNCVRQRFASGAIHRWAFEKRGTSLEVTVTGSLITSDGDLAVCAALDGVAIARAPRSSVDAHLASKRLVALLEDWQPPSVGFFLYYPSRRHVPAALQAFVGMLKSHSRQSRSR